MTAADDRLFLPAASLDVLRQRAKMLQRLRAFFDGLGFFEVTTPSLSSDTVVDLHLDPLRVTMFADPRHVERGPTWYLQTSPEFHMKRLLAAGAKAIYQIGPAFRATENGELHNTEFTMVEWYRVGDDMAAGMRLLSDVAECLLSCGAADQISYAEAFQQRLGFNPHGATKAQLQAAASEFRTPSARDSRDDCLTILWSHGVEPELGAMRPTIVFDFPASQAALARIRPDTYPVAERFELYLRGVELANGYHELTDVDEFKSRMDRTNRARIAGDKPALPTANRLVSAMESGIPPTTGVAMGFDRVVMMAIGESLLEKVLAFPFSRA